MRTIISDKYGIEIKVYYGRYSVVSIENGFISDS
jgi:hypothetical protein